MRGSLLVESGHCFKCTGYEFMEDTLYHKLKAGVEI